MTDTCLVDDAAALEQLVESALQQSRVALDTEFVRERTYFPRVGVIQIAWSEEDCFLVDAVACTDLSPLKALLESENVVCVLHAPDQDGEIFARDVGASPRNIFDTQTAGGFLGMSATASLADLVSTMRGVDLPKTETRTDWTARPLSEKQIRYCLDDVRYLPDVYDAMVERARERGRLDWIREEMSVYDDPAMYALSDPREQYRRIGRTGKLPPRQLAVLRELAAWREKEARRRDLPRKHVLDDDVLVGVARTRPRDEKGLKKARKLSGSDAKRYGGALLGAVSRGLKLPDDACPKKAPPPEDDDGFPARVDLALACARGRGTREGVAPGLLGTRAEFESFVRHVEDPDPERHRLLRGWRREFFGDDLLALFRGERVVRYDPESGTPDIAPAE